MNFREFFEANPEEVKKAAGCANFEEFKKLVDKNGIAYKDEEEVKSAYDFVKGENGELSDDLLEAASGGAKRRGSEYTELDPSKVYKNNQGRMIYKK